MSDGLRTPVEVMSVDEMADRIEELEAENKRLRLEVVHAIDTVDVAINQVRILVTKLEDWLDVDLIEQAISDVLLEGGSYRDAAEYVTRATLAELTGDKQ